MSVPERIASDFHRFGFKKHQSSVANLKSALTSELYDNFNLDKDKLEFLRKLRIICSEDGENHMKTCKGCGYERKIENGLFVIDQEIKSINAFYVFEVEDSNIFSPEEESKQDDRINKIMEELQKLGFGQQIIFDELEELKNLYKLGKKNWLQLLKGKLVDATSQKIIDATVVKVIFDGLSDGYDDFTKMLH